jgi:hypothetical protein
MQIIHIIVHSFSGATGKRRQLLAGGLERGQIISLRADIIETGNDKVVIENECIWRRPGADAPIKDKRIITISAPSKGKFQIDFDVTMEILIDVVIEKTNIRCSVDAWILIWQ